MRPIIMGPNDAAPLWTLYVDPEDDRVLQIERVDDEDNLVENEAELEEYIEEIGDESATIR